MKLPEIRIFYAALYRRSISEPLWKQFGWREILDSDETLEHYAQNYRDSWAKHGTDILTALCDVLGIEFYKPIIDVACIPGVAQASDPIIMSFQYLPDQFVDALTHELCHVLLTDNDAYSIKSSQAEIDLADRWHTLFGDEFDFDTLVHIPVQALCKYVYIDVLNDQDRLRRDIADVRNNKPYADAWKYVETHDYMAIIDTLRSDYAALRTRL